MTGGLAASLVGLAAFASSAHASEQTWTGTASTVWDTSALNWSGGVAWTNGNDALFTGTPTNNVATATGLTVGAITLDNTFTGSVTLSGANTVSSTTVNGGTLLLGNNTAAGSGTINLGGGTLGFSASGLTVANAINVTGTTTIGQAANNSATLSGALTGSGTLQNAATGTAPNLFFTGDLSGFTGIIKYTNGNSDRATWRVGATGGTTVDLANATVNLVSGANANCSFGFIDGTTVANTLKIGTLTGNGTFQGSFNTTVTNTLEVASGTFSGVIGRSGNSMDRLSLNKVGAGTLTLSGLNIYTQGTTVNGGTLNLNTGGSTGTIRGTLTINSGATVKLNATDALGFTSGVSVTTVNVNGGTIDNTVAGNNSFLASYVLTGGTMSSTGGGKFNFNTGTGITSNASSTTSTISAGIDNRGNTMTYSVASGTTSSGNDLLVSGAIVGTGGLTKTGAGLLKLTGTNTYSGTTMISAGTVKVASGGSISTSATTINGSGATLAGAGTVGGITLTSGTISPGDTGIGTLTGASLAWAGGNNLTFDLSAVDSTADLLSLSGALTKSGNGAYAFDFSGGMAGQTYTLINFGSTDFSVGDFSVNSGISGTFGLSGTSLTFTAVPEPHEFALAIIGLLGVLVFIRRRNQQA